MTNLPPVRLIDLGLTGAVRTQAVYHAVARLGTANSLDTVILTRPAAPYLCIGYHQSVDDHLDQAACKLRGLPIVRRSIGGGTTYLDSDQLFYQFIFHRDRVPPTPERMVAYLLRGPAQALVILGFEATLREGQELVIGERRIAGIGGGWIGESAVVVGNYLLDFDYAALSAVWAAPWPAYQELAREALSDSVGTLWSIQPDLEIATLQQALVSQLATALEREITPGHLTPAEQQLAVELQKTLTAPEYLTEIKRRPDAGRPALKISAGHFIHAEQWRAGGADYRAALRVRDGIIIRGRVEISEIGEWRGLDLPIEQREYANWRSTLELAHA